jgi:hypothetical protein
LDLLAAFSCALLDAAFVHHERAPQREMFG